MNYGFKVTTHGRAVLAACMALSAPLEIVRAAVGSGAVGEGTELADIHELLCYEAEAAVTDRRHEGDRLYLTVQYSNEGSAARAFLLSEFMLFARDPRTGEQTDLIYATLGDYRQGVPAYAAALPPSLWNFPLAVVVSDEIQVTVSAPPGLVTYEELADITEKLAIRDIGLTIPATGWAEDGGGRYPWRIDVPVAEATPLMIPSVTVMEQGEETAEGCGLAPRAETAEGAVRFWAVEPPEADIPILVTLLRDSTGVVLAAPGTGGSLDLPIATEQSPGLVKPGTGLKIEADGTMSVDMATDEEFESLLGAAESSGEGA